MKFEIVGNVNVKGNVQTFSKTLDAKSRQNAEDMLYASIGSNYRVHRRSIKIHELKEVKK